MKKSGILVLALGFVFSLAAVAQDKMPPQPERMHKKEFKQGERPKLSAQKRAGYMAVDLELTDAQRAKLQALFEKQDKMREEHHAEVKKLREQEMAKMEAARKANDAEMEKILGTEKYQQFKAKQAERMQKMKDRWSNRHDRPAFQGKRMPRPETETAK